MSEAQNPVAAVAAGEPGGVGPARLARTGRAPRPQDAPALAEAAKGFESVLLTKLLEEMRRTVGESGLLDDETSRQMEGMFWHYLGEDLGRAGGLGLWKDLYRQFGRPPSAAPESTSAVEQSL